MKEQCLVTLKDPRKKCQVPIKVVPSESLFIFELKYLKLKQPGNRNSRFGKIPTAHLDYYF